MVGVNEASEASRESQALKLDLCVELRTATDQGVKHVGVKWRWGSRKGVESKASWELPLGAAFS